MHLTVPVRDNNAIDEIAFALHFKTLFAGDEKFIEDLIGLAHDVHELLPDHEVTKAVTLQINSLQANDQATEKPSGIICYKKSEKVPDRREWKLQVEGNWIVIGCSEYTSWKQISATAKQLLQAAITKLNLSVNPIVEIVYQCADKFTCHGDKTSLKEVFNTDSDFLTRHIILNDPSSWHVHQGWFTESDKAGATFLHNLNINMHNRSLLSPDGAQQESVHETIISHFIRVQKSNDLEISSSEELMGSLENGKPNYLDDVLNIAHDLNKSVVKQLLSAEMQQKIGL